jgi:hypothetical protein
MNDDFIEAKSAKGEGMTRNMRDASNFHAFRRDICATGE